MDAQAKARGKRHQNHDGQRQAGGRSAEPGITIAGTRRERREGGTGQGEQDTRAAVEPQVVLNGLIGHRLWRGTAKGVETQRRRHQATGHQ